MPRTAGLRLYGCGWADAKFDIDNAVIVFGAGRLQCGVYNAAPFWQGTYKYLCS